MGILDFLKGAIPGPFDDWAIDAVSRVVSGGGGDNPVLRNLPAPVGPIRPEPVGGPAAGQSPYDEGWFEGRQPWDPGEWIQDVPAAAPAAGAYEYAGCKITLPVTQKTRLYAPPGYVVVRPKRADGSPGPPVAMLKRVAMACKLWKAQAKPPISARDWKTLRRARAVTGRLDTVVKTANQVTGKADYRRVRRSSGK